MVQRSPLITLLVMAIHVLLTDVFFKGCQHNGGNVSDFPVSKMWFIIFTFLTRVRAVLLGLGIAMTGI